MKTVIDRQKLYVPVWNGNRALSHEDQVRVTLRFPGFLDLATLPRPDVALVTTLMVLAGNKGTDGQLLILTDLASVTKLTLATAKWAQKDGVKDAPVPQTSDLVRQVVEFAAAYVRPLVTKVEGLEGYANGADLVDGPSALAGLVCELALELWTAHSLTQEKKTA